MPSDTAIQPWSLSMLLGSAQSWNVTLTIPGTPYPFPISASAWEYAVRQPGDNGTGTPLIKITPTSSAAGVLTVTASASLALVNIQIYPAATSGLALGSYPHALWEYPGTPSATAFFNGSLIVTAAPQP